MIRSLGLLFASVADSIFLTFSMMYCKKTSGPRTKNSQTPKMSTSWLRTKNGQDQQKCQKYQPGLGPATETTAKTIKTNQQTSDNKNHKSSKC